MHKKDPNLNINLSGINLLTPTMLASGILGLSADIFDRIYDEKAGAIVTKSISVNPRKPYSNPTIIGVENGMLNAVGLANPGVKEFKKEISEIKSPIPVIVSVFGSSSEEISKVISMIDSDIISAFELNLACPHVKGVGLEMGSDPKIVHQIVLDAKKSTSKPVFAKLSPNIIDLVNVAKSAEDAGADAITATNTIRAMAINIDTRSPILSNNIGGMSGRSLKPISIRCVYELYQQVKIPIIGCGGVENWKDVLEYLMAGASAVQIGTAISYQGVEIFRNISNGLNKYLSNEGIKDVNNIIGIAHRA